MNIYIACALTHVPRDRFQSYANFIHELAAALKREVPGSVIKYALVDSDPQLAGKPAVDRARLCYLWDRHMVEQAEIVIADASYPSIGLGIELQIAESKGTPIILCVQSDAAHRAASITYENPDHSQHELQIGDGLVSLMALGLPNLLGVVPYQTSTEGIEKIVAMVDRYNPA